MLACPPGEYIEGPSCAPPGSSSDRTENVWRRANNPSFLFVSHHHILCGTPALAAAMPPQRISRKCVALINACTDQRIYCILKRMEEPRIHMPNPAGLCLCCPGLLGVVASKRSLSREWVGRRTGAASRASSQARLQSKAYT